MDEKALMQLLATMFGPKPAQPTPQGPDIGSMLAQLRNDPQGDANHAYSPGVANAGNPMTNGFFNQSAASLSPEARQATQGRSAMTQWAQQGQVPGVDAAGLNSLMANMTPIPTGNEGVPNQEFSDPFFKRRQQQGWLGSAAPLSVQGGGNPNTGFDIHDPVPNNGIGHLLKPQLPPGAVMGDGTTNYFPQLGDPRYVDQMSVPYGEQTPPTMNSLLKKKKPVAIR